MFSIDGKGKRWLDGRSQLGQMKKKKREHFLIIIKLPFNHRGLDSPTKYRNIISSSSFPSLSFSFRYTNLLCGNKLPLTLLRRWCFFPLLTETRWKKAAAQKDLSAKPKILSYSSLFNSRSSSDSGNNNDDKSNSWFRRWEMWCEKKNCLSRATTREYRSGDEKGLLANWLPCKNRNGIKVP